MDREEITKRIIDKISYRKHNIHHSDRRGEGHRTIIYYLASRGGSALSGEISNDVGISTPRLAYILKELESDGIVERNVQAEDKRKVCVTLTAKGKEKINRHHRNNKEKIRKVLDKLKIEDMEALERILAVLEEVEKERE